MTTFVHGHALCGREPSRSLYAKYAGNCWCCAKALGVGEAIHLVKTGTRHAWLCDDCIAKRSLSDIPAIRQIEVEIAGRRSGLVSMNPISDRERYDALFRELIELEAKRRQLRKEMAAK